MKQVSRIYSDWSWEIKKKKESYWENNIRYSFRFNILEPQKGKKKDNGKEVIFEEIIVKGQEFSQTGKNSSHRFKKCYKSETGWMQRKPHLGISQEVWWKSKAERKY